MAVTLDAPQQHPTWRVACDRPGCHSRLYLQALDEVAAIHRVVEEYGWSVVPVEWPKGYGLLNCPCFHEEAGHG